VEAANLRNLATKIQFRLSARPEFGAIVSTAKPGAKDGWLDFGRFSPGFRRKRFLRRAVE
jgi:hypothetical protein